MGVTRLDDLPDNGVVRSLVDARQASRELKGSPQRVSGTNLAYFTSDLGSAFNWSGTLDTIDPFSGAAYASFLITLTSKVAKVPMTDVAIVAYYSPDGTSWEEYPLERALAENYHGVPPNVARFFSSLTDAGVPQNASVYSFQLWGAAGTRMAFKVQAFGTDEVTVSITRTA